MPKCKQKKVLFSDYISDSVIELARITYKSSGASIYIPKNIVKSINLNSEVTSLVMFSAGDDGFFLIKNTALAAKLKPWILDLRRKVLKK